MNKSKISSRLMRKKRIRKNVAGTKARPRLSVYRSGKHIYAQIIDGAGEKVIVAVSTLTKELAGAIKSGSNVEAAKVVGRSIAEKAKAAGVTKVAFDRSGFRYHGRVKALADSAREHGLVF